MALITTAEVKTFLQLSGTTYDSLIDNLLPVVRDFVVYDFLQNSFKRKDIYIQATTLSFDSSGGTISDNDSNFIENDFTDGIDIIVEGSISNDGLYEVDTAAAGVLTLSFSNHLDGALVDEAAGENIRITRVQFPKGLKIPVSQLFSHLISKDQLKGVKSESLGDYAVAYMEDLPKTLIRKFEKFRRLSW